MNNEDELRLDVPNYNSIPCRKCKYGWPNCMSCSCAKFKNKPSKVYYESKDCPEFIEK